MTCESRGFVRAGTSCRPSRGGCDAEDVCDGAQAACPDTFLAAGVVCRGPDGACDVAETCDGETDVCPADLVAAAGVECRGAVRDCDVAEVCDGSSAACPSDVVLDTTHVCRPAAGPCDREESCDGVAGVCPGDSFFGPTTECRPAAGECDAPERCDGASAAACARAVGMDMRAECRGWMAVRSAAVRLADGARSAMSASDESRATRVLKDLVAGVINGVASVPSGMATAALAGVNPVFGLYAVTVAPAVGALLASSQLMQIATNGAAALTAREGIDGLAGSEREQTLFLLVALAGAFLVLFGLLRAGRLLRYVSFPVMTAFLSGVATVLVMDQTAKLFGFESDRPTNLGRFVDLVVSLPEVSVSSAVIGGVALLVILGLTRTPLANVASVAGIVVPTIVAVIWKPDGVELVRDVSEIPQGLPPLGLPDLGLVTLDVVGSAFALAVIIAVQGAGISQTYENPDGTKSDPSRDMLAQGAANVAGSLVSGMPTGGSLGQTALAASTGARSRLTGVVHSVAMLGIILLAPGLVSLVPVPALAAVMIVAGFSAVRFEAMAFVWRTRGPARLVLVLTFLATLLVSIAAAVALGVVSAVVLYVFTSVSRVRVNALEPRDDGRIHVTDVPPKPADESITVIDVYGSLFFAGARRLRELLPRPEGSRRSVVILRLRGNSQVGATAIEVLNEYAHALAAGGGRLFLCGMEPAVSKRLMRAKRLELHEEVAIFPATGVLRDSTRQAVAAANDYLRMRRDDVADALVWPK